MSKCVVCDKEINGIDEFGTIESPKCIHCWFDSGDLFPLSKHVDGYEDKAARIDNEHLEKLDKIIICDRCCGRGKIKIGAESNKCGKCSGYGEVIGIICPSCDGYGTKEHECDCEYCNHHDEKCYYCDGSGVAFIAHKTNVKPIKETVRSYWI